MNFFRRHSNILVQIGLLVIFVSLATGNSVVAYEQNRALIFQSQPIDYSYFLQFAAKDYNFSFDQRFSVNPTGNNMFMMFFHLPSFIDGAAGLNHDVHFEQIKYSTVLLYRLFQTPNVIFIFYSILSLLPLLYALYIVRTSKYSIGVLASVVAGWALYTGLFFAGVKSGNGGDLFRPSLLLIPFMFNFFLSLIYKRPSAEKFLFLNLLLAVREEALIFGLFGIAYKFLQERRDRESHKISLGLFSNWILWALAAVFYFVWSIYLSNTRWITEGLYAARSASVIQHIFIVVGIVVMATVASFMYLRRRGLWQRYMAEFCAITMLSLFLLLFWISSPNKLIPIPFHSFHFFFGFSIATILICMLDTHLQKKKIRNILIAVMLCVGGIFLVKGVFVGDQSLMARFFLYRQEGQEASLVSKAHDTLNRYDPILVDYSTLGAFYDFNTVYAYNSLPSYIVNDNTRYYPQNKLLVENLLQTQVRFIVIGNSSTSTISSLLQEAGKKTKLIDTNAKYSFYRVE